MHERILAYLFFTQFNPKEILLTTMAESGGPQPDLILGESIGMVAEVSVGSCTYLPPMRK